MSTEAGAGRTSGFYEQDGAPAAHTGQAWLPCDASPGVSTDFLLTGQCGHLALDTAGERGKRTLLLWGRMFSSFIA